ncbi:MAG: hypothetical protein E7099_02555 [Mediterranea massiliensis]|nr:hypothetical protein [Mediterranea massiliensis]
MERTRETLFDSIKRFQAAWEMVESTTPEIDSLRWDLQYVADTLVRRDKQLCISCNGYLTEKYPHIIFVSAHYGLHPITETEALERPIESHILALQKVGCFLYDCLTKEVSVTPIESANQEPLKPMFFSFV